MTLSACARREKRNWQMPDKGLGALILRAGFITVFSQLALLLASLPASILLPASLPVQLGLTLPVLVGLVLFVLPVFVERIFGRQEEAPLVQTWFGATVFGALVVVGIGFALGVSNGIATVSEAQIAALLLLFFFNLSIVRHWLCTT